MTEDIDVIQKKRQAALEKLRKRRGEPRQQVFSSRVDLEKDRLSLLIKTYRSLAGAAADPSEGETDDEGETLLPPQDDAPDLGAAPHPDVPLLQGPEIASTAPSGTELPRVAKARTEAARRDEKARAAIAKWRSLMQNRRSRQMAPGENPPPLHPMPPEEKRVMFFDLLTVDFLESSRVWISADPDALELSSTSREEIEKLQENAIYRRRVLDELSKMNEQELDALATYLRSVQPTDKPAV
jgi:hypothetical protein